MTRTLIIAGALMLAAAPAAAQNTAEPANTTIATNDPTANNCGVSSVQIDASPRLDLSKSVSGSASPGATLTWTLFATNTGNRDATTVTLAGSGGGWRWILTGPAHQVSTVDNGASMAQYADGTNSKTDAYTRSGTLTMDRLAIGAMVRTTVSSYFAGQIPELVIWTAALSTADRQAGEGNQKAFYGTP